MSEKIIDIEDLKSLKLYEIAQALPKGVLLHAHLGATVNMVDFIMHLKEIRSDIFNKIYVLKDTEKLMKQKICLLRKLNESKLDILFKIYSFLKVQYNIPDTVYNNISIEDKKKLSLIKKKINNDVKNNLNDTVNDALSSTLTDDKKDYTLDIKFITNHINIINEILYYITDDDTYCNSLNFNSTTNKNDVNTILQPDKFFPAFNDNLEYDMKYLLAYYPDGPISDGFELLSTLKPEKLLENLKNATRIQTIDQYYDWNSFDSITYRFSYLIKHKDIFPLYLKYLLFNIGKSDNILGIELKSNLGKYYNLDTVCKYKYNSKTYTIYNHNVNEEEGYGRAGEIAKMEEIIHETNANHEYVKCNIHAGLVRLSFYNSDTLKKLCKAITSYVISAVDIIGNESTKEGNLPNSEYTSVLVNECSHLQLSNHSGEFSLQEDINEGYAGIKNIIDVLVLKKLKDIKARKLKSSHSLESSIDDIRSTYDATKSEEYVNRIRVGHGIALFDYPEIIGLYKKEGIHIELNPISNKIMGHTKNLANHPGRTYIKQGLRVSINSDDASIFNYDNVSCDWLFVLGLWNLTFDEIYFICKCSIEDSFFTNEIKTEMLSIFEEKFNEWKSYAENNLDDAIAEALPFLSKYSPEVHKFDSNVTSYINEEVDRLSALQVGGSYCKSCNKSNCNCMKQNNCASCNQNKKKYLKYKSKYITEKNKI